jgi:hypothetical protein
MKWNYLSIAGAALVSCALAFPALSQTVPDWWNLYGIQTAAPAGNYSPANAGQLRALGVAAVERLVSDYTDGTQKAPDQDSVNRYQALRLFAGSNYSMVNCGQVLNIADALRFRATGTHVPLQGTAAYYSPAALGQLKNAFDFPIGGSAVREMPPAGSTWGVAPWTPIPLNPRVERERKFRASGASPDATSLVEGDLVSYSQSATNAIIGALGSGQLDQWQLDDYYTSLSGLGLTTVYEVTPGDPDEQWFVDIYFDTPSYLNYRNNIATRVRTRFDELFNGVVKGPPFNPLLELNKWMTGQFTSPERIEFQSKSNLRTGYSSATMPVGGFQPASDGYYEVRQYRDIYRPGGGSMLLDGQRIGESIRKVFYPFQNGAMLVAQTAPVGIAYRWKDIVNPDQDGTPNLQKFFAPELNDQLTGAAINLISGTSANQDSVANRWVGGGVVFASPRTISAIEFVHGEVGGSGNKGFYDDLSNPPRAQRLTGSGTWEDIPGWSAATEYPDYLYPFSAAVEDRTYFSSGPAVEALGFRIIGKLIRSAGTWVRWREFRCYEPSTQPSQCALGYLTAVYSDGLVPSVETVKLLPKAIVISQRKRTRLRVSNTVRDFFRTQFSNSALGGELLLMTLDIAHVFDPVQVLSRMQNSALLPTVPGSGRITDDAAAAGRVGTFVELEFQVDEEWSPHMTTTLGLSDALQKDLEHLSAVGRTGSGLTTTENFKTKYQEALQRLWQADVFHTVTGLTPAAGTNGSQFLIAGQNFGASPAANIVTIGGVPATVVASTPSQLTVQVPAGAPLGPQPVTCTIGGRVATSPYWFVVQ